MITKILLILHLVFSLQTAYSQLSFPYVEFETRHDLYNYLSCYYNKTGSYSHLKEKHLMIYNNCKNGKPIVQGVILQNSDSLNKFLVLETNFCGQTNNIKTNTYSNIKNHTLNKKAS
ncbi:MAG: hypothetical protein N4A45_02865 [Flavobacteriales bacterium]|nr:hypothetical protein [Flavobacteriales bacterium]